MKPTPSKKLRKATLRAFDIAYTNHATALAESIRKLIHTNECSDEGGWFAYWTPNGQTEDRYFDRRVSGFESEAEAVEALIVTAIEQLAASQAECERLQGELKQAAGPKE